jgi:hypothetical protein
MKTAPLLSGGFVDMGDRRQKLALSPGERVARVRRFHQPARAG